MSGIGEKFSSYKASKAMLFWCCLGTAILTMVLGFTWGGWVTGGSAEERAETAANEAVAALASEICFTRFLAAPDAAVKLAALKEESSYSRDDIIEDGGWVTFANHDEPVDGAAEACADRLAEAELSVTKEIPVADAAPTAMTAVPAAAVN